MHRSAALASMLAAAFLLSMLAPTAHAGGRDAVKGAAIGAGVGALVGGGSGAKRGAVAGAIVGAVR